MAKETIGHEPTALHVVNAAGLTVIVHPVT